jgi:hypothetical protein
MQPGHKMESGQMTKSHSKMKSSKGAGDAMKDDKMGAGKMHEGGNP